MSDHQSTSQSENPASVTVTVSSDEADTQTQERKGPLSHIKVLDLTRIVAGPYCTMILGDLGAEIIKIERPGSGDESRKWGPPYVNHSPETCYFVCLNRNKKSVCVDLKTAEGRNIIFDLSKKCDVLIENYVPGSLEKLNLGYDDLKKLSPHLIYCSLTGYGSKGPYKNRPGYDVIASSFGGLMSITGSENGPPCKVGVAMTDIATGLYAHGAILAALIERTKTGEGQKIDCNLLSTQMACLINIGSNYLNAGEEGLRWGSSHVSIVPYRAFETLDGGYITVGGGSDLQFQDLCQRLGVRELSINSDYSTNKDRVANRKKLNEVLELKFKSKSLDDWLECFEGSSFPYGPVNKMSQAFNDKHVKEIGLVKAIDHPVAGTVRVVGPPVEFSSSVNKVQSPPPMLGQHTEEVLQDILKYPADKIKSLKRKQDVATVRLKLRKPKSRKKVNWTEETVDNEHMDKKKSKCCCIYQKPRAHDESSSDEDEDECDHCQGHVELKKKIPKEPGQGPSPESPVQSMIVA